MSPRAIVNSIVALVAVLVTAALAAVAVIGGLPSTGTSELTANGVEGRFVVRDEPPPPVAPLPTLPAVVPEPSSEGVTPPTLPATTVPRATTTIPVEIVPATLPPVSPSSWSIERDGTTVTARIEPAAPRVGDTVTIFYTVAGAGDSCCGSSLELPADNAMAAVNLPPMAPNGCPMDRVTSWSTKVAAARPGPFTFLVHGSRFERLCTAPPSVPVSVTLHATFQVLPAL